MLFRNGFKGGWEKKEAELDFKKNEIETNQIYESI